MISAIIRWWRQPSYRQLQLENHTLRDALRNANVELVKHRRLLADLKNANPRTTDIFMKV